MALKWIQSYFDDRAQITEIDSVQGNISLQVSHSTPQILKQGRVPQSSIFSILCFFLFTSTTSNKMPRPVYKCFLCDVRWRHYVRLILTAKTRKVINKGQASYQKQNRLYLNTSLGRITSKCPQYFSLQHFPRNMILILCYYLLLFNYIINIEFLLSLMLFLFVYTTFTVALLLLLNLHYVSVYTECCIFSVSISQLVYHTIWSTSKVPTQTLKVIVITVQIIFFTF